MRHSRLGHALFNILVVGTVTTTIGATAACNPAVFDDLSDEMWVASSGSPDGLDSTDYAGAVAWGGSSAPGVKVFATGDRPSWAELSFDASGTLTSSALRVDSFLTSAQRITGIPAVAGDPDSIVGASKGTIALGISAGDVAFIVLLNPDTFAFTDNITLSTGTDFVDAIAMGPTDAGGAEADIVAVRSRSSGSRLTIVAEYQSSGTTYSQVSCLLAKEQGYDVTIANVDSVSADSEIIIGMGARSRTSGTGEVLILAGSLVETAQGIGDDVACTDAGALLATIAAPNMEPDFGAAVVVGDFDGDGANGGKGNDLAVSAPSANRVYVYFNVDTSAALGTPIEITPPPGAEAYGTKLAAGDFNGDGTDELVITDPKADVDAIVNSGRADIVEFASSAVASTSTVLDAEAENSQNFGRSVTVASFNGADMLVVGARDEVFSYFRTPVDGDVDDRQ